VGKVKNANCMHTFLFLRKERKLWPVVCVNFYSRLPGIRPYNIEMRLCVYYNMYSNICRCAKEGNKQITDSITTIYCDVKSSQLAKLWPAGEMGT
jgi:hypothetical protein